MILQPLAFLDRQEVNFKRSLLHYEITRSDTARQPINHILFPQYCPYLLLFKFVYLILSLLSSIYPFAILFQTDGFYVPSLGLERAITKSRTSSTAWVDPVEFPEHLEALRNVEKRITQLTGLPINNQVGAGYIFCFGALVIPFVLFSCIYQQTYLILV